MKLCASYKINPKLWDQLDEVRFSVQAMSQAVLMLEEHKDKRVIIELLDMDLHNFTVEKIHELLDEYPNLYFDCYSMTDLINITDDRRRYMYHYPVNTYTMLNLLIHLKVSDVTIGEPLAFDLRNLKLFLLSQEHPVRIRVTPALGRPELFNQMKDVDDGLCHFWMLPQHMGFYNDYIDAVDLYDENVTREETLVKLFLNGAYNKALKYYLRNGECEITADLIDKQLLDRRLTCNQVCMQNRCHFCQTFTNFYTTVKQLQNLSDSEDSVEK